jgi:hypothetical protein
MSADIRKLPVKRRLRADVPPFDPNNPAHIEAWETLFDFGRAAMREASK